LRLTDESGFINARYFLDDDMTNGPASVVSDANFITKYGVASNQSTRIVRTEVYEGNLTAAGSVCLIYSKSDQNFSYNSTRIEDAGTE
jgi:hypothetical protein